MTKRSLAIFCLVSLLSYQSATSQDTAENSSPLRKFVDPYSEDFARLATGLVALECAAIANRVGGDYYEKEHERLFDAGYAVFLEVVLEISSHPESELSAPFETDREIGAFAVGQAYGKAQQKLLQEYMKSPEEDLERFYMSEFEARNCIAVGR